jgi:toxin CptA
MPWLILAIFNLVLALAYGWLFLTLVPLALAGAVYHWNLNGRLSLERSVVGLTITADGLQARQRNGHPYPVIADPGSRLYSQLAILKLTPVDATHNPSTVLLWAGIRGGGNVPDDLHRQLRAWLHLGPSGSQTKH